MKSQVSPISQINEEE